MKKYFLLVLFLTPAATHAQLAKGEIEKTQLTIFLDAAREFIFGPVLYFLIALAFIIFVWGVVKYFISDAEGEKTAAKSLMLWGIGGFVLILTLWGIVNMFVNFLGLGEQTLGPLPGAPSVPEPE